ncbi:hypothetical protein OL239_04105 [Arthrobacter sp. ATA002]|uniref:hypothetical protein n=1 Tax=Arthrobacter sp. ATA002 TaxID=2991715 RepID=UPI0022A7B1B3|nr:hypothetical protein [Arthrobacter sp. ATA002]WAP52454.1 hypothetical protein OL239_04105 [Arthrobacter sp. ATA002]
MKRLLEILFWITLAAFLVSGAIVVFGQMAGVLLLNGNIVAGVDAAFADLTFSLATACALIAFILQYFKRTADDDAGEGRDEG